MNFKPVVFLGVDPGVSGAIAVIDGAGYPIAYTPLKDTETDIYEALCMLREKFAMCALIEKVHAMPKQGVVSSFKFGQNYGFLRGIFTAIGAKIEYVTPQEWQKGMKCLSRGDKNVTKQRAQELFPDIKITHVCADAFLIAEYGRRFIFDK
jgi:crossover junction endodeoxyribonuclease RuvC